MPSVTVQDVAAGAWLVRSHPIDDAVYGDEWVCAVVVVSDKNRPHVARVYGLNAKVTPEQLRVFDEKLAEMGFTRRIFEQTRVRELHIKTPRSAEDHES